MDSPSVDSSVTADRRLRRLYGIGLVEYATLLSQQGGRCAICHRFPATRRFNVDHDHATGLIRGLLCWRCNQGLELFDDSADTFVRGHDYLRNPPAAAFGWRVPPKKLKGRNRWSFGAR